MTDRLLAVALHDVEPRWADRCRDIRAWLGEWGVGRVSLLVIPAPAPDGRPLAEQDPALVAWLRERAAAGDTVAQHGLAHERACESRWPRSTLAQWQGGAAAEFPGLDGAETIARVRTGRDILRACGLEPYGFVAPGYAYTPELRAELQRTFAWSADLWGLSTRCRRLHMPAVGLGVSTASKRAVSTRFVRTGARLARRVLRLDVHPADFDSPGHVRALEAALAAASGRRPITYDELVA
jgi:predicted deacetylase